VSNRRALGQGLDALLGSDIDISAVQTSVPQGIRMIAISQLVPNPDQPREKFDVETLAELADSILQQGVIQPILAEERSDGRFVIVAGERRWRASLQAGLTEIPAIVRSLTEKQKLEISLVENIQREDLSAIEEARAYHRLMEVLGLSQQEVADRVGKNRSTVSNSIRLLKLPEKMKEAVKTGQMSAGHARALLAITNPADQELLFAEIIGHGYSVRESEALAIEMNRGHGDKRIVEKPIKQRDPEIDRLEQQLIESLGTKVIMKGNLERGRMEISWFNQEDLTRIYEIVVADEKRV